MNKIITLIAMLISFGLFAQVQPPFTQATKRMAEYEKRAKLDESSLLSNIDYRSVGPTVMSGRVTDLDINPDNPREFYVAYASGGLWKTENNGVSFDPIFDNQSVLTVGDIAVDWKRNIIWVGTGENNSSRSSYSGNGIFKSEDGGKSWTHHGLEESHHIGRIILHPDNPQVLWVGVLGHLYSPNKERGLYKSVDGGKSWKKTLFVNEDAGIIDLVIHPENPNELYAAAWERKRRAWNFWESGAGSGIYKSTNGGETWTNITKGDNKFPTGDGVGRIGLDMAVQNGQSYLYAILDNQNRRPKEEEDEEKLTKDELRQMSKEDFLLIDQDLLSGFLSENRFPKTDEFKIENIMKLAKEGTITPSTLVEYLEDANSLLFDTPVIGAEVYLSKDGGTSWERTHEEFLDDVYYSYGYYFGQIRVAPYDPLKIIIVGVPILISSDGGKTFKSINGENVHVDHHAIWINPDLSGHFIIGNDGGVNITYDDGENWVKCNAPSVGQFYSVEIDMARPYNIYGGLQDNGVWVGPSNYKNSTSWHSSGQYPYKGLLGGDGMQVAVDHRDNQTVYTGYQFGNYFRINKETGDSKFISPKHKLGERPLRFNWQTPIHLSVHNQDILFMGSHKFHRSLNQGDDFETLSEDLTKGGKKGDVAFGTLTSIHESPLRFGLIYVGSDDGMVHSSSDGGYTWNNISGSLPKDMWVSRVYASSHEKSEVYLSLNGYRWDDFSSYVYHSSDYGKTWKRIGLDLPAEPVNVIKDDPENADIIYVGTDNGLYVSLNQGKTFMGMNRGLPDAAVHDLVVHPRDKELVVGTHGRSIYVADVSHVQMLADSILAKPMHLFSIGNIRHSSNWGSNWSKWLEANEPESKIPVYVKAGGAVNVQIFSQDSLELFSFEEEIGKGLNYISYNLEVSEDKTEAYKTELNSKLKEDEDKIDLKKAKNDKYYLAPGKYKVVIAKGGEILEGSLEVVDK